MATKEQQRRADAKRRGKRARGWACVAYPDSVPSDWVQQLEEKHIPILISPLHDRDLNADGTEKKAHWHIMVAFAHESSEMQAQDVLGCVNGTLPVRLGSIQGYARYLTHADNPEKAQYKPEDVKALSGANWYTLAYTQMQADRLLLQDIFAFIRTSGIVSYALLCDYANDFRPDWLDTVYRRTAQITAYMRAYLWESQGNQGKIPPREEWQKLKEQDKKRTEEICDLVLEGFSLKENEMRTKAGEFKD